jgi:alkylhydroperoxidase/carboxymuconolactone decarboxylase family protein YurZ
MQPKIRTAGARKSSRLAGIHQPAGFHPGRANIEPKQMEMEVRHMSLFKTVSENEATGKVKEVYDDLKATKKIDFVPNFWKALSINPDHLEAVWQKLKAVMKPGKLDLRTKEIIALAVSITNNCEY